MVLGNWKATYKRMELEHSLTPYTNIKSKWIKYLKVRPDTIKLIEENIWFKEELPEPEPCKNHEMVITFFKCDKTEHMVKKLEPAIALLDKYDKPYDVVYTNFVGTIVYEDEWQVAVSVRVGKMV